MYSQLEVSVLRRFRQFLMTPGQMLCFYGPDLDKFKAALQAMTKKQLLVKERLKGAYSLTPAGFEAMKSCGP